MIEIVLMKFDWIILSFNSFQLAIILNLVDRFVIPMESPLGIVPIKFHQRIKCSSKKLVDHNNPK